MRARGTRPALSLRAKSRGPRAPGSCPRSWPCSGSAGRGPTTFPRLAPSKRRNAEGEPDGSGSPLSRLLTEGPGPIRAWADRFQHDLGVVGEVRPETLIGKDSPMRSAINRLHASCRRLFLPLAILAGLVCPSAATADSMSLSIAPAPVESITSEVSWTANSEAGTFPAVAANNPGVPCAAKSGWRRRHDPHAVAHLSKRAGAGSYTGSVNFTPAGTGQYTLCGWLETPVWVGRNDGRAGDGKHVAADRRPSTRHQSVPEPGASGRGARGRSRSISLRWSEALRQFVVEGFPATRQAACELCRRRRHALSDRPGSSSVAGGSSPVRTWQPLRAGSYIFCAWADEADDEGLYPEATAHLLVRVGVCSGPWVGIGEASDDPRSPRTSPRSWRGLAVLGAAGGDGVGGATSYRQPVRRDRPLVRDGAYACTVRLEWVQVRHARPIRAGVPARAGRTQLSCWGAPRRWRGGLATISDEGLRCGLVPPAVIADLRSRALERGTAPLLLTWPLRRSRRWTVGGSDRDRRWPIEKSDAARAALRNPSDAPLRALRFQGWRGLTPLRPLATCGSGPRL